MRCVTSPLQAFLSSSAETEQLKCLPICSYSSQAASESRVPTSTMIKALLAAQEQALAALLTVQEKAAAAQEKAATDFLVLFKEKQVLAKSCVWFALSYT